MSTIGSFHSLSVISGLRCASSLALTRITCSNLGHALETVVLNELERRKAEVGYVKTDEGFEVDFYVRYLAGGEELLQVYADPTSAATLERELRALIQAERDYPRAVRRLLVLTRDPARLRMASGSARLIQSVSAARMARSALSGDSWASGFMQRWHP